MLAKWRKLGHEQRGASLVELALVLMLLLLMVMGIVDLGRAFNDQIVLTNACREGARYASRFPADSAGIIEVTRRAAEGNGIDPDAIEVTITGLGASEGQPIRVTTAYDFQMSLGGLVGINTPIVLRTHTEMVVFGLD
ncbi:MAG: pilus assembly protein [Chloroflexi bacterium]|nr:pilus assembly protein [Chloroflexota bacterium]